MKTLKCHVKCQYWNRPDAFTIEVEDDATEEEIEQELIRAAMEAASFDCWIKD